MNNKTNMYLNTNINNACLDCPDRTVGCHASCNKYKQFRKELESYNAKCKMIIMCNNF